MHPRQAKTIIAFFGGTGYDFGQSLEEKGYVNLDASVASGGRNPDSNMLLLNDSLGDEQVRFGYDGCHKRGGGLFAYGIEEPCEHLFAQIKKQCADNPSVKKIFLVIFKKYVKIPPFQKLILKRI